MSVDVVVGDFRRKRLLSGFSDFPYGALGVTVLSVIWGLSICVVLMGSCAGFCVRGFWCRVICSFRSRVLHLLVLLLHLFGWVLLLSSLVLGIGTEPVFV